jgi:mRNA interferase HigB
LLERWYTLERAARNAAPKAKVLNRERVRFEAAGASYHLVAAFDFQRQIALVKFVGARRTCITASTPL